MYPKPTFQEKNPLRAQHFMPLCINEIVFSFSIDKNKMFWNEKWLTKVQYGILVSTVENTNINNLVFQL